MDQANNIYASRQRIFIVPRKLKAKGKKMYDPFNLTEIKSAFKNKGFVVLKPLVDDSELDFISEEVEKNLGDIKMGQASAFHSNDMILKLSSCTNLIFKPQYIEVLKGILATELLEIQHSKYNSKNKAGGSKVPIHQDFPFFPHTDDRLVAFNFHLDGSNPDNGGMFGYPGLWDKPLPHEETDQGFKEIPKRFRKLSEPEHFICPPGGVSIHSSFLPHGSNDTFSARRRMLVYQLRHPETKQIGGAIWKCSGLNPETMDYNEPVYRFSNELYDGRKLWEPKEYFE